jgi:hypothetical protein
MSWSRTPQSIYNDNFLKTVVYPKDIKNSLLPNGALSFLIYLQNNETDVVIQIVYQCINYSLSNALIIALAMQ